MISKRNYLCTTHKYEEKEEVELKGSVRRKEMISLIKEKV
jgi:hypothetical protein